MGQDPLHFKPRRSRSGARASPEEQYVYTHFEGMEWSVHGFDGYAHSDDPGWKPRRGRRPQFWQTGSRPPAGGAPHPGSQAAAPPRPPPEVQRHLTALGLQREPQSLEQLKTAYQGAAKRFHPDMVASADASAARFQAATDALHFLRARL